MSWLKVGWGTSGFGAVEGLGLRVSGAKKRSGPKSLACNLEEMHVFSTVRPTGLHVELYKFNRHSQKLYTVPLS